MPSESIIALNKGISSYMGYGFGQAEDYEEDYEEEETGSFLADSMPEDLDRDGYEHGKSDGYQYSPAPWYQLCLIAGVEEFVDQYQAGYVRGYWEGVNERDREENEFMQQ